MKEERGDAVRAFIAGFEGEEGVFDGGGFGAGEKLVDIFAPVIEGLGQCGENMGGVHILQGEGVVLASQ